MRLILKRASASRPSGEWDAADFDVAADGALVGRIFKANAAPVGNPWMWSLAFEHHEDRTPTHGHAESREAAMTASQKAGDGSRNLYGGNPLPEAELPFRSLPPLTA
jgi:hypothetical protein